MSVATSTTVGLDDFEIEDFSFSDCLLIKDGSAPIIDLGEFADLLFFDHDDASYSSDDESMPSLETVHPLSPSHFPSFFGPQAHTDGASLLEECWSSDEDDGCFSDEDDDDDAAPILLPGQVHPIGTKIEKWFPVFFGSPIMAPFDGEVVAYRVEEGWYYVVYEDGDSEDMWVWEVDFYKKEDEED